MKRNNISTGNCGEYFVAAELERRGFSVAVPMSNTELFDILAFDRKTHKQWAIQVKTTSSKKNKWILNKKSEKISNDNIIYVFVKLNELETPQYFVVPSADVAKQVYETHRKWLNLPRKDGEPHKDNNMRNFEDPSNKYLNNWNAFL